MDRDRGTLAADDCSDTGPCQVAERRNRDDDVYLELPARVGQDERRMQLRACRYWTGLRRSGGLPRIADLTTAGMADFADHAVVLDFGQGAADPAIAMLGARLAEECGAAHGVRRLSDVPGSSLLSAIACRYAQVTASRAPVRFPARFVNQRGRTLACRGILLPFSSDGTRVDQIMGVINWKEGVDPAMAAGLMRELEIAMAGGA